MPARNGSLFYHRLNRDGTHDSICCGCYLTIATKDHECNLAEEEEAHLCDPLQSFEVSQYAYRAIERVDRAITEQRAQQQSELHSS